MSLPAALQPDSDSEDELPHGWEERTDEDGRVFFVKYVRCRWLYRKRPIFLYQIHLILAVTTRRKHNGVIQKREKQSECTVNYRSVGRKR